MHEVYYATIVYLISPEPSKNCYNLSTLHSIKKNAIIIGILATFLLW